MLLWTADTDGSLKWYVATDLEGKAHSTVRYIKQYSQTGKSGNKQVMVFPTLRMGCTRGSREGRAYAKS